MNRIKIPTPDELGVRLAGVDRLLTAKTWERAAIVFAYTTNEGKGGRQNPAPPKMTMREFSRRGFAGLTSNKTVERYRAAWVSAIDNRWAVAVWPGDTVDLPTEPFPAWPYGVAEEVEETEVDVEAELERLRSRPSQSDRVLGSLDRAASALRSFTASIETEQLDDETRAALAIGIMRLRDEAQQFLDSLGVSVEAVGG